MQACPLPFDENNVLAALCRSNFVDFVKEFWEVVPGAGRLIWNWHIGVICAELEKAAERLFLGLPREHDTVVNVPPGTSKSTVATILFPAWVWTRMPEARILSSSHTSDLVLDLAGKSRDVIGSDKYRAAFPEIQVREDTDAKGHYRNEQGGERKICTVAGVSPMGFHAHFLIIDDPIDPKKVLSEVELRTAQRFVEEEIVSRKVDKAVSVTFLIMQRLGMGDPTDVMVKAGRRPGAFPCRSICLPAELSRGGDGEFGVGNVEPPELAKRYVGGLLDPRRLGRPVLDDYRSRGELFYATQFLQRPYAALGGMFKSFYFNKRARAAPHDAQRVRYFDRASTQDGGCATAGVLLARSKDGSYYVEDVLHGHWEPVERNERMRAAALRDRNRYGPDHEPIIWVEAEGGSSGRDAWLGVVRALEGFPVFEHQVSRAGSKDVRAEPWSAQLAGGNVFLVDNGEAEGTGRAAWDVDGFVAEHLAFRPDPSRVRRTGGRCDRVDAAAGAFACLVKQRPAQALRIYDLNAGKKGLHRLVVVPRSVLPTLEITNPHIVISFEGPEFAREGVMPDVHGMRSAVVPGGEALLPGVQVTREAVRLASSLPSGGMLAGIHEAGRGEPPPSFPSRLDWTAIRFADIDPADHQEKWDENLAPYGKPPGELAMDRDAGRKLWAFLTRKRVTNWEVAVFVDDGGTDRRAASAAQAVLEVLRLPPDKGIWRADGAGTGLNKHVIAMVKATRGLVNG